MRDGQPSVYMMANNFYGTLYVGMTSNPAVRVMQHRDGTFAGFTERYNVKRLVWHDTAATMADAIIAEKRIKRWRRDWKIALIECDNPHWNDLGPAIGLPPLRV